MCIFIVGILMALNAAVVFAATTTGPWHYYGPIDGYKYKAQNKAISDSSGARANTAVYSDGSGNIPAGYMVVSAHLWDEDGSAVRIADYFYNPSPCAGISNTTTNYKVEGTYYARGFTKAFDNGYYKEYWPYASPNVNYP